MLRERYRFECRDVANCDVIIMGELRESVVEAAQSHLKDVHGRDVSEADVEPYIESIEA